MRLSKHQYLEKFGHLRKGGWARKKNLRASMVSHILARPHDQLGRTAIQVNWAQQAEGHLSPWISATSNIDYALWDISNRLAKGEDTIKLAVIKQSKGADSGGWEWRERGKTRSIRGAEVWTMACGEIQEERKHAPYWDKMHWDRAHRRALACGEVLYFGRIFGESVVADLIFTRDVSLSRTLPWLEIDKERLLTDSRAFPSLCRGICSDRTLNLGALTLCADGSALLGGMRRIPTGHRRGGE
jgi:hypothetical protein